MILNLFVICIFIITYINQVCSVEKLEAEWKAYKLKYKKYYMNGGDYSWYKVFEENMELMERHNNRAKEGKLGWFMGINKFTDMPSERFVDLFGKCNATFDTFAIYSIPDESIPQAEMVDWRTKDAVTEVRDQRYELYGGIFSFLGGLEGQLKIKKGKNVTLSPQNVIDCYPSSLRVCFMPSVFVDTFGKLGISSEKDYTYTGAVDTCNENPDKVEFTLKNLQRVKNEDRFLEYAVQQIGPVIVSVHVTDRFMKYGSGVFFDRTCSPDKVNHQMLLVGYGVEERVHYWILKNSWGKDWGENGYIRMSRESTNQCGITSSAYVPILM